MAEWGNPNDRVHQVDLAGRPGSGGTVIYVSPDGTEEADVPAMDNLTQKEMEGIGWKRKHSGLGAAARNFLGNSLYGFGEEVASSIAAGGANIGPGGMPASGPATGVKPPSYDEAYNRTVADRKESSAEHPVAAGVGGLAGATIGSPMPGGPLSQGGSKIKSAAKLFGQGELASFAGGAGTAEGDVPTRLKAGAENAVAGAPISLLLGATGASVARDPHTFQQPELSLTSPSTWVNPESLKDAGALARISSLRTTPSEAADVAAQYMRGSADPVQGLVNFGREVNAAKIGGKPVFRAETAGPMVAKATGAKSVHGQAVRSAESAAEQAGNLPNMDRAFTDIRSQGRASLGENPIDAGKRVPDFLGAIGAVEDRILPGTPAPGNPAQVVRPQYAPFSDAKDAVRWLREKANQRGGYVASAEDAEKAIVGKELGNASARINDEVEGQVAKTLGPKGAADYAHAKDQYGLMSRVEEMANPTRSATAAPFSLSSVMEGGALAQTAASMGMSPGAIITARQAGRLLGRQKNVNPTRADRFQRFAEGIEGEGINPLWQAAGATARGARNLPATLEKAGGIAGGNDLADPDDPRLWEVRKQIARKWLDQFYNAKE